MSNTYLHTYNKNHPLISQYNEDKSLAQQVEEEYYKEAEKEAKQSGLGGFVAFILIILAIGYIQFIHTPAINANTPSISSGVSEVK